MRRDGRLRRRHGAERRRPARSRRTGRCACWAATAWARRRWSKTRDGLAAPTLRPASCSRVRTSPGSRRNARARLGIGYVPQGRLVFPQLTVTRQPADRPGGAGGPGRRAERLASVHELFPVLRGDGQTPGGHALGRAAAAAGDRPRADCPAAAAGAGRANRGHPAVDRAGDSARAAPGPRSDRGGHAACRAVPGFRRRAWPTTYYVLDGGMVALRGSVEALDRAAVNDLLAV